MKLHILVLGGILCLSAAVLAQTNNNNTAQSANRVKTGTPNQAVTGCVDEQNGHYVLRDERTNQLIVLKPPSANADDDFARFVGHQAQASGTMEGGTLTVTNISKYADMCPIGK
jgi:hypothetical protein